MLTVTDRARRLVRSVVHDLADPGAGLRITAGPDGEPHLDLAPRPAPRDQVIALRDAPRLFLEERTAMLLDDAVLDAAADDAREPSFVLSRRASSAA